jgi:hypothetical protein
MQASLAVIGFLLGLLAWWQSGQWLWSIGALLMIANWPYTLLGMMPTNNRLMATDPKESDHRARSLVERGGRLHAVRTTLAAVAMVTFLAALDI